MTTAKKTRFIIAGLGNRGRDSFAKALLAFPDRGFPEFKEKAEIVALVDPNQGRSRVANEVLGTNIPAYTSMADAVKEVEADWAIVTTPDYLHADTCEVALDNGLNVVVDKPLATSVWECNRIIEAGKRNDKKVIVGHNLRYHEHMLELAKIVRSGVIGDVLHVESSEILDLDHGGSYFHRWHSEFDKTGGLLAHKCSHQLDIINWVLDDSPVGLSAIGSRTYYKERTDIEHGPRCTECSRTAECPHFCDVDSHDQRLRKLYLDNEEEDGYKRDLCVFSDRNTINDQEVLNIRYSKGAIGSFNLITFAPKEYSYFYFTGTKGRLEYTVRFDETKKQGDTSDKGGAEMGLFFERGKPSIQLFMNDGTVKNIDVEKKHGNYGHGGADVKLIATLLDVPIDNVDPIQRATPEQATSAVAIADMAARSIADNGRYVTIDETGKDFPPAVNNIK